ncbi:cupin domain-containing protein [Shewanella mangrovisoli]|uniref:(R)-mandelonitrile lyase n=1 Tax=Shewanella mangrovisoli TaxID=2864211 RepID=UPI0035B6D17C
MNTLETASMTLIPAGTQQPIKGPSEWFTGEVVISSLFNAPPPARVGMAVVNFSAGARTHWHSHPLGQMLLVTQGEGWTQCEGGERTTIRPGDLIWCNCGKRHWHGATASSSMQHVAVQEALEGKVVDWFESVTDTVYLNGDSVGK